MAKRDIKYGNDSFKIWEKHNSNISFEVLFWDLWVAILLDRKFDNKWDLMVNYLYNNHSHYSSGNCEAMVTHIHHLRDELSSKGLEAYELIVGLDGDFLKKQTLKATKKVIDLNFQNKEKSEWMHCTPRKMCIDNALQGSWHKFPINPKKHADALRKKFKKKTMYTKGQTSALYDKLYAYIEKYETKVSLAELLALYRAFLSVILENMENIDDSYGYIGDLSVEVFRKYLELDWRQLPIESQDYFIDIIKYVIWEDYGLTYEIYPLMFDSLTESESIKAESILKVERNELIEFHFEYQAENALTILGSLYEKNNEFDKFPYIAKEMSTRAWKRITTLSKAAEITGKDKIALDVYEVAIKEHENSTERFRGDHTEYLRKEYTKLKARITKRNNKNT